MKIYFGVGYEINDKQELLGEVKTFKDAFRIINKRINLEESKGRVKHYYSRITLCPDYYWIDYGSYSHFFKIGELPDNSKELLDEYNNELIRERKERDAKL